MVNLALNQPPAHEDIMPRISTKVSILSSQGSSSATSTFSSHAKKAVKAGKDLTSCIEHKFSPRRPAPPFFLKTEQEGFKRQASKPPKEVEPWEPEGGGVESKTQPDGSFCWHPDLRARKVRLSPDRCSASWRGASFGGFLVSEQPLQKKPFGRWFEIMIEDVDPQWHDGLGIGVGLHPSESSNLVADPGGFYEGSAIENLPDIWMLGYDGRVKLPGVNRYFNSKELPSGNWRPADLRPGDRVGIVASFDGHLMLFVNDELVVMISFAEVPWRGKLYAIVDLDGCTKAIRLMDNEAFPTHEVTHVLSVMRENDFEKTELISDLRATEDEELKARAKAKQQLYGAQKHGSMTFD